MNLCNAVTNLSFSEKKGRIRKHTWHESKYLKIVEYAVLQYGFNEVSVFHPSVDDFIANDFEIEYDTKQ